VSISTDRLAVLRDQLGLTWQLAQVVLADVSDRECLWLPSERSWTVRRDDEGRWIPDWQQPEPADVAQPSLAWTMWQTIWWWSVLLDQLRGDGTFRREDIAWPGAEAGVVTLRELYGRWDAFLAGLGEADLDSGELTGFPFDDDRPFVQVVAWATVELAKNVAEMGVLRRLARDQTSTTAAATVS
jgi:DinB superfamily